MTSLSIWHGHLRSTFFSILEASIDIKSAINEPHFCSIWNFPSMFNRNFVEILEVAIWFSLDMDRKKCSPPALLLLRRLHYTISFTWYSTITITLDSSSSLLWGSAIFYFSIWTQTSVLAMPFSHLSSMMLAFYFFLKRSDSFVKISLAFHCFSVKHHLNLLLSLRTLYWWSFRDSNFLLKFIAHRKALIQIEMFISEQLWEKEEKIIRKMRERLF